MSGDDDGDDDRISQKFAHNVVNQLRSKPLRILGLFDD